MDKKIQIPGLYIIRFQTAPSTPAPFSHYDTFKLYIDSESKINVDFSITYIDRDALTEDEILNEGFTLNDNFSWKGGLNPLWIDEFQKLLSNSKIIRKREEDEYQDFIEVELEEDGKRVTIYPVVKEKWQYFLQELMQAIFEVSKKEEPFKLSYLDIQGQASVLLEFEASFATKTFKSSKNGGTDTILPWAQLQTVMDTVYRAEFVDDHAVESKPTKSGKYLSAGDGLWYQLGVAVVETTSKSKDLQKIERLFDSLK
jgi:hypothetical protein